MSPQDRELLLRARGILAREEISSICAALLLAEKSSGYSAVYLLEYLKKALHPHATLAAWQYYNAPLRAWDVDRKLKDRLAWIDWMLGEEA